MSTEVKEKPQIETLQLKVGGMSCSFCAESIRKAVGRQPGVEEVHVSIAHEEALVRYDPNGTSAMQIKDTLRGLGYTVRDPRKVENIEEQEAAMEEEKKNLFTAAFFAVTIILGMALMWLGLVPMRPWYRWLAWGVASFVFFWTGRHILRMAWGAARRGITNQHVLLTAGALGGYIAGILGTPILAIGWSGLAGFPAVDFFAVTVFLTTYHLLSGYVSLLVRTRASESVRKLLDLQPPTARVVRDGREEEVAIDEVEVADLVRVRPGERVPVDGEVVEGVGAVDESLVTGEPIPAEKAPGDEMIGGSVNHTGSFLVRVTRVGEDSFLRQVARHVEEAKALKPGIIELVDRVLKHYVPIVLTLSLGTLLFWTLIWGLFDAPLWTRGLYAALSVLVLGYPCALGMATPLALIRGGGMAAERGILIRSGEAFQVLKDVRYVVLDKTGTITVGQPRVTEVIPFGEFTREEVLRYAASAEAPSEHPLARAIVDCAEAEGLALSQPPLFSSITGAGVEAEVDGRDVRVGTSGLMQEAGIALDEIRAALDAEERKGRTAVILAVDHRAAGMISIADTLKPDARDAIAGMKAEGLIPVMLTGDNAQTAETIAAQVGIEEVQARVLPAEKAQRVRELQSEGDRVMMVGDGINDAPALMQADVGLAIGAGTDIAIESSDVILIGERLGAVVDAYHIGRESYRRTVQNLWLAFFFNGVGIPLATTGLVHPVWAMVAMAASVTAVLANSFGGRLIPSRRPAETEKPSELARVVLDVPTIHCAGCVRAVEGALQNLDGVKEAEGSAETKHVRVSYDRERASLTDIEAAVASRNFRVTQVMTGDGTRRQR